MKNVLVVFENKRHIDICVDKFINKFIKNLEGFVSYQQHQNIVRTEDTIYKLIGCGFPYIMRLDDKLNGMRFDDVMIHGDVVLTKHVEYGIKSRMVEVKEFIEFE